jgi:hypothetical protein
MKANFEHITNLQYKVKALGARVQAFESGEKYASMKSAFNTQLSAKDREIRRLKSELAKSHAQLITMRHSWSQVFDDLDKEHAKELERKDRVLKMMEERALNAERQRDDAKTKITEKSRELYQAKSELEDEKEKIQRLVAQINLNHENSSIPSSQKPNRKKITNNREATGRKPGGQPGHKGHPRKRYAPTNTIEIPAPPEYTSSPDYKLTGKIITKQVVGISLSLVVDEYSTPEFRHVRTGQRVHASFPDGVVNDVNYGGSVKAFAFLLNNRYNVSVANVSDFLSELTGGDLKVSTGMINGLSREFSLKTDDDQKRIFADMLASPVINTDFTAARVNGQQVNVMVCATPTAVIYFARKTKGHEGIKGTPVESSPNIVVHDHDITFYFYGRAHQECLDHILRYLKGSIDNEPGRTWNGLMRELIREMIHFRNGLDPNDERNPNQIDPEKYAAFETRYDDILNLAKQEYEFEPPGRYYRDGFNLHRRMLKYKESHLLFLLDRRVPHSNSLSERLLRIYKRKQHQVMTFRSFEGLDNLCRSLGMIASMRAQGKNLFEGVTAVFDKQAEPDGNSLVSQLLKDAV